MQHTDATDDGEALYPPRRRAWAAVGILVVTAVLSYTDRQVLSLLVDPIRRDLHISDTQFSLLIGTAFAVVYGIAGVPLGALADRLSRRNLILCGLLIWSAATIGCGLARGFTAMFVFRILVGLGEAALSPAAISLISDIFPPARRGTAVGLFLSGIAIGAGASILVGGGVLRAVDLGVLAATPLAGLAPWRAVLLLIGAPGLLWSLAVLVIREPPRRGGCVSDAKPAPLAAPLQMALWRRTAPIYAVLALASLCDNAVGAWSPSLLIRSFGKDPGQVGIVLGLLLAFGFGGGVLAGGMLADRAGSLARKLRVCLASAAAILPVAWAMTSTQYLVVLLAIPFYFALSGVVTAIGFSAILNAVPNRARGLAMSISFLLNVAIGGGLGPTLVALAAAGLSGPSAPLGDPLSMIVACGYLLVLATLALALMMGRRQKGSPT